MFSLIKMAPYIAIGTGIAIISAYGWGHHKGKQYERLKWKAEQEQMLRLKARAEKERNEALVAIDRIELELAEKQAELDRAEAEKIDDAIATSSIDSTFCVDPGVARVFDRATGLKPGIGTATNPRPCPADVPQVPGPAATN